MKVYLEMEMLMVLEFATHKKILYSPLTESCRIHVYVL